MFNLFKKSEPEPEILKNIKGRIERVGFLPRTEYSMTYLLKLKEYPKVFRGTLWDDTIPAYEAVLGKENDEVSFLCNETNQFAIESFKNITFSLVK